MEQKDNILPWQQGTTPLMLAPMQGVTNRGLRRLFIDWVHPDTVFTEFVRVNRNTRRKLSKADRQEVAATPGSVPLVTQLIGNNEQGLTAAALAAQDAGALHINLNMGCPFGRMTSGPTGGGMLKVPELLPEILHALRRAVRGSFSVKMRAGYQDPRQIFSLLPLLEEVGIDFLILHPRTVVQKYAGTADHAITAEVVRRAPFPVIANGDINSSAFGQQLLADTGAAGLMLGRGAIADPLLFKRLRGQAPAEPSETERAAELRRYLSELLECYSNLFCGEVQVLSKVKEVLAFIQDPELAGTLKKLRRSRSFASFQEALDELR